ncbi:hypothetical protein HDU91_001640 [Kappamyces sp. JEL0680]|nr:hypothetical protein HDU91_001640 [Kappamyces sp. JEL0680]
MIVALSDNILRCGATVRLYAPSGNHVDVTVADKCNMADGCHANNIDAPVGVWNALGIDLSRGRVQITYDYI